jgi:hypothetical protein
MNHILNFAEFLNESFHMPDGTPIGVDRYHRPIAGPTVGLLAEGAKYLINIEYVVDYNWFNSPSSMLENNLLSAKIEKKIESFTIKSSEKVGKNYIAEVALISLVDKTELKKYFDGHSVSAEKYTVK